MPINVSKVGKKVMQEKVFGRSFKDSPKLKHQMAKDIFSGIFNTPGGPVELPIIGMSRATLNQFFIRLTKGMLATFYEDLNYFNLSFSVTQLSQFGKETASFSAATSSFIADQRGGGVFRFWRAMANDRVGEGVWIYQFYDAALLMVRHGLYIVPQKMELI
jgi:hypothetical protein